MFIKSFVHFLLFSDVWKPSAEKIIGNLFGSGTCLGGALGLTTLALIISHAFSKDYDWIELLEHHVRHCRYGSGSQLCVVHYLQDV